MKKNILVILFSIIAVVGNSKNKKANPVIQGVYTLVSYNAGPHMEQVSNESYEINFEAPTKTIAVYVGCNRITYKYECGSAGFIKITAMSSTKMACLDGIETEFNTNFLKANRYKLSQKNIELYKGKTMLLMLRKKEPQTNSANRVSSQSLVGNYKLFSLKNRNEMKTGDYKKTKITIDEKTISANVGCNHIGSPFKTEGNTISNLKLTMTEMYCKDVDDLERLFVDDLRKINSFQIKQDTLEFYQNKELLMVLKRAND